MRLSRAVRPARSLALLLLLPLGGCAEGLRAESPEAAAAPVFSRALRAEQESGLGADGYLDALDAAVANPNAPGALEVVAASTAILVSFTPPGLEELPQSAVAFRTRKDLGKTAARLEAAWYAAAPKAGEGEFSGAEANDADPRPAMRGLIATALHALALFTGEEAAASTWRARSGCATEAALVGPVGPAPLASLEEGPALRRGEALPARFEGLLPFHPVATPAKVEADACGLDAIGERPQAGGRIAIVDFDNPRRQVLRFALTAGSAARLEVGGVPLLARRPEDGAGAVTTFGRALAEPGRLRVVVRLALRGGREPGPSRVVLRAWDDSGLPLEARAPSPGAFASSAARPLPARGVLEARAFSPEGKRQGVAPDEVSALDRDPDRAALAAAALLALGRAREARGALELRAGARLGDRGRDQETTLPPTLELLQGRALEASGDLPKQVGFELLAASQRRLRAAWPGAYEPVLGEALLAAKRAGPEEGDAAALARLGAGARGKRTAPLLAFEALVAGRAGMVDLRDAAFGALAGRVPGSPLLSGLDARVHERAGEAELRGLCEGAGGPGGRGGSACLDALMRAGEYGRAERELERLRRLRGRASLRESEVELALRKGELERAARAYDALAPARRALLPMLGPVALSAPPGPGLEGALFRLRRDATSAGDAPFSLGALDHLFATREAAPGAEGPGDAGSSRLLEEIAGFEEEGARLVASDRKKAFLPGAATAVLRRFERYGIDARGLLRYVTYDLRRVSDTTSVAAGAAGELPLAEGKGMARFLRKRIHKKDGRVVEPEEAGGAQQAASDLSQLEPGDYVEQIAYGAVLPGDSGQIAVDTPDLLPERTSVREAVIEVSYPEGLPLSFWAHPRLGAPAEERKGGRETRRYRLEGAAPRRQEDGTPRVERPVAVAFGTLSWKSMARALGEILLGLPDGDPLVADWAERAARAGGPPASEREVVERVVRAAGEALRVSDSSDLSDVAATYGGGDPPSARAALELGQGSRSWLVLRALRVLGIRAELAVAENEPYSAEPDFPARPGRFTHPLVVAHVRSANEKGGDGSDATQALWVDADVEGPPLPPGRLSPELRARAFLRTSGERSGEIGLVPEDATGRGDEVDLRLSLDALGDARGTFTARIRGRAAQAMLDVFETVVGSDRRQLLSGVVLGWLPRADVEEVTLGQDASAFELTLRAKVTLRGYGQPEGKDGRSWVLPGLEPVHLVFPRPFVGTLGATYASRGARESALSVDTPMLFHVRRRVELPPGAEATRLPTPLRVEGPGLVAERRAELSGGALVDDFSLTLPTGVVSPGDYEAFVARVLAVDAGFLAGTRLRAPAPKKTAESTPGKEGAP